MKSDSLEGSINELDISAVKTNNLTDAIGIVSSAVSKSNKCSVLFSTATTLLRLRQLVLGDRSSMDADGDGDISEAEDRISEAQLITGISECPQDFSSVADEMSLGLVVIQNLRAKEHLLAALESGGPSGQLGRFNAATIFDRILTSIIDDVQILDKAHLIEQLTMLAGYIRSLRRSAKSWVEAELEASIAQAHGGLQQLKNVPICRKEDSTTPILLTKLTHDALEATTKEIELIENEYHHRLIEQQIPEALDHGRITGQVGSIDEAAVEITKLSAALAHARDWPSRTPDSERLVNVAAFMHDLRKLVRGGAWSSVEAHLGSLPEGMDGPPRQEVDLAQDEVNNRNILDAVQKGLEEGAPTGSIGRLDLRSISTDLLTKKIQYAKKLGCKTDRAASFLSVAEFILRMRQVLHEKGFEALDQIELQSTLENIAEDQPGRTEVDAVLRTVENLIVQKALVEALSSGGIGNSVEVSDMDHISVTELDTALTQSKMLKVCTEIVELRTQVAEVVFKLRKSLAATDWTPLVSPIIDELRQLMKGDDTDLEAVVRPEVIAVENKYHYVLIEREIVTSLKSGQMLGVVGDVITSSIITASLEKSCEHAKRWIDRCKTPWSTALLEAGEFVLGMRRLVLQGDWPMVRSQGQTQPESIKQGTVDAAQQELQLIFNEADNVWQISTFTDALETGGPTMSRAGDGLDLKGLQFEHLLRTIREAQRAGCKTYFAESLLSMATLVSTARRALADKNWGDLTYDTWLKPEVQTEEPRSLIDVMKGCDMTDLGYPAAVKELTIIRNEICDRIVRAELEKAMKRRNDAWLERGEPGTSAEFPDLAESLACAEDLGSRSQVARAAYKGAVQVRALSAALDYQDWDSVGDLCKEFERTPKQNAQAKRFIGLAKEAWSDNRVCNRLQRALGSINGSSQSPAALSTAIQETSGLQLGKTTKAVLHIAETAHNYYEGLDSVKLDDKILSDLGEVAIPALAIVQQLHRTGNELRLKNRILEALEVGSLVLQDDGSADMDKLSIEKLQGVLTSQEGLVPSSDDMRVLLETAHMMKDLRQAVQFKMSDESWKRLESIYDGIEIRVNRHELDELVIPEARRFRQFIDDNKHRNELREIITTDRVEGTAQDVEMWRLNAARVQSVQASANDWSFKSTETKSLLRLLGPLGKLRDALANQDYDAVASILESPEESELDQPAENFWGLAWEEVELITCYRRRVALMGILRDALSDGYIERQEKKTFEKDAEMPSLFIADFSTGNVEKLKTAMADATAAEFIDSGDEEVSIDIPRVTSA